MKNRFLFISLSLIVFIGGCIPISRFPEGTREEPIKGSTSIAHVYGGRVWYWEFIVDPEDINLSQDDVSSIVSNSDKPSSPVFLAVTDLHHDIVIEELTIPEGWAMELEVARFLRIDLIDDHRDVVNFIFTISIPEDAVLGQHSILYAIRYQGRGVVFNDFTFRVLEEDTG